MFGIHKDTKKVRYAVIGAGNIAQVAVLPSFAHAKENSVPTVLVSHDPAKLGELGSRYGIQRLGSYDELEHFAGDFDAAYVTVPNNEHRAFVERLAKMKKHVLCEKPMAVTEADCAAMNQAAAENGIKLMIAYRLHYEEANLRAIEVARSGVIGDVRAFTSAFTQQVREGDIRTKKSLGGGAIYDMGVYCINAARYLFGDEPSEVFAYANVRTDERFAGVDETTVALMRFSQGRLAQFTTSLGMADTSTLRIIGTKGDLRVEPAYGYVEPLKHYLTVDGKTTEHTFAKRDQFAPELVAFSKAVVENTAIEPSGEEGLADVRIVRALLESADKGVPVKLAPFARERRPDMSQEMHKPPVRTAPPTVHAPSPSK